MSSLINIDNKWNEYNNLVTKHGVDSEQVKAYLATNTELADEIKNPVGNKVVDELVKSSGITPEKEGANDVTPLLNTETANNPIVNAATTDASDQVGQNQKTNPGFLSLAREKFSSFTDMFKKDPNENIISDDYIPKSFDKDIGKAPEFSFGKKQTLGKGIDKNYEELIGGRLSESVPDTLTSPEATDIAGKTGGGLSAGQAAAGLQVGLSALSTISQNKSLDEAIDSIGDSIDVLDSTKREIAGSYAQDRIDIKSDLSETNQNAALEMMSKIKSNNTEPVTNLNIPSRAAEDIKSNINEKLNTFFSAQKSKSDDVLEAMKTGAETSVARITGDINSLKEEAKKMEDAKRNNWINTGIDVASAGVSLAGGPAGMIGSSALQSLKKTNEYS